MKDLFAALRKTSIALFILCVSCPVVFGQGPLPPPGPPGPTMKTLDQLDAKLDTTNSKVDTANTKLGQVDAKTEKRTPIDAAHTPGDASNLFIINTPGSYYFTGNIQGVSGKNGISINADDVTVDLNGLALIGLPSGNVNGINVPSAHRNLRIYNGSVRGWSGTGVDCSRATNSQFDHLRVSQNDVGFSCGDGNVIATTSAEANTSDGIRTGNRCTLTACYAANNLAYNGILTGDSCTVTASTAVSNVNGISVNNHCTIIGCTAASNTSVGISASTNATIKDCTAALNGMGITASNSLIVNCTASQNKGDGIQAGARCQIISNNASANTNGGAGIRATGANNRIDSNHCINNADYGIKSGGAQTDFIVRNTCLFNGGAPSTTATINYSPKSGAYFGVLSNPGDANPSAWANF